VSQLHVLIVDDEKNIRSTLRVCLEGLGAEVAESASPQAALDAMARAAYDVVFLDLRLGMHSGLDLIPLLLAENPNVAIIVVTAYATVEPRSRPCAEESGTICQNPFRPPRSAISSNAWPRSGR
jgi:NtrC-family two-component system response regulator AlgB